MAAKLTMGHLAVLSKKLTNAQAKVETVKKKADGIVHHLVDTGIIGGTAFVAGAIQGRTGGVNLPGNVSLELAAGVVLNGLGYLGIGGNHLHSVGNGFLAAHLSTLGRGQGKLMLEKKNKELAAQGKPLTGTGVHLLGNVATNREPVPARETVIQG